MLRATVLSALVSSSLIAAPQLALAGSPHRPDRPVVRSMGGGYGPDAPRPTVVATQREGGRAVAAPLDLPRFSSDPVYPQVGPVVVVLPQPVAPRRVRPSSVSPVDPTAVVARTPSGRVFIGPSVHAPLIVASGAAIGAEARPYAPPSFQFLGAPSGRHMSGAVKLTHGLKAPDSLSTGPKVVWLDGRGAPVAPAADNPHVRRLK